MYSALFNQIVVISVTRKKRLFMEFYSSAMLLLYLHAFFMMFSTFTLHQMHNFYGVQTRNVKENVVDEDIAQTQPKRVANHLGSNFKMMAEV